MLANRGLFVVHIIGYTLGSRRAAVEKRAARLLHNEA
jgi:hypothetical protein